MQLNANKISCLPQDNIRTVRNEQRVLLPICSTPCVSAIPMPVELLTFAGKNTVLLVGFLNVPKRSYHKHFFPK